MRRQLLCFILWHVTLKFVVTKSIFDYRPCAPFFLNGNVSDLFHMSCMCNATYCDNYAKFDISLLAQSEAIVYRTSLYGRERMSPSRVFWQKHESPIYAGENAIKIIVNPYKTYQPIFGWGAAFTDTAVHLIDSLSKQLQMNFMTSYFGDDGLEFNMARVPIAGSDYSLRPFSYNDNHPGDFNLSQFSLQNEDFARHRWMREAQKLRKSEKIWYVGSPWSAPAWMKTNKMINYGGHIVNNATYWQTWANYFIKFLDGYANKGFEFFAITVQNEPNVQSQYNSMLFWPREERDFVANYLGPTLRRSKFGNITRLLVNDAVRSLVVEFAESALEHHQSAQFVDGIAIHTYDMDTSLLVNDLINCKFPNMFQISTEFCILDVPDLGNWERGETYMKNLIDQSNHFNQAFIDWNLAVDLKGGPSWAGSAFDSLVIVDQNKDEFYKQPGFYARGHFSKFVPRTSRRIALEVIESANVNRGRISRFEKTNVNNSNVIIDATAFLRPDGGRVLVVHNPTESSTNLLIADRKRRGQTLSLNLSPRSFISVVWR